MTNYLIFRHGSNTANQPMCEKMAVAIVEAKNGREACEKAIAEEGVRCFANQRLTYLCESKVYRNKEALESWLSLVEEEMAA